MKFKRAIIALMTAAVLTSSVFFAACGSKKPADDNEPPTIEETDKTVETTKLTVYEAPALLSSSEKLKAYVDDTELFVYETRVNHARTFTYTYSKDVGQVVNFDFEGKVHMKVEINGAESLSQVTVRPSSYAVQTSVDGNTIEFDLQYSANYTLEYLTDKDAQNADPADNALHIFANPIEENAISADNVPDDVIYIGPGVYSAGAIPMTSGKTLYLAGGAYVYGQIRAENLENITIRGRGIISGSIYDRTKDNEFTLPIELRYCKNVNIEGITLLDPAGWAVTLYFCENVHTDNVKIITARGNGDGFSVQSCKNVNINGGFVRTWDDTLVVKNSDRGTTADITFDNVVVWTDLAQTCEVGFETYGATMDNITFKNITVLHAYHKAVMSIHNSDDADITNVTYQSITIEDPQMFGDTRDDGENDFLFDITIAYSEEWTKSGGNRGTVENVKVENVKILKALPESICCRINGESKGSAVKNVTVKGVEVDGVMLDTAEKLKISSNAYSSGITVSNVDYEVFGAGVLLPYKLELKDNEIAKTIVPSKAQNGIEVPSFAVIDVEETYMGQQLGIEGAVFSTAHGTGTTLKGVIDDSGDFGDSTIANAFDGDRNTAYEGKAWTGENEEFAAITVDFGKEVSPGVIRVYLGKDNSYLTDFNISVFIKKDAAATSYTRALSPAMYSATPATGNYFDIKLSSTLKCTTLQLRIFRVDGMTGQQKLSINEIAFFPSSLSTNKTIVDSTEQSDVYKADYLLDGNEGTYWEAAKTSDGKVDAFIIVDLGEIYDIQYIVMHLPPALTWEPRDQEIQIQISTDGVNWTTVKEKTVFTFDPMTGNSNTVRLATATAARYVKLNITSNSSNYGAQLSELYVY